MSNLDPKHDTPGREWLSHLKAFFQGTYGTNAQMSTKEERLRAMAAIRWMGAEAKMVKALLEGSDKSPQPIEGIEEALNAIAEDLN